MCMPCRAHHASVPVLRCCGQGFDHGVNRLVVWDCRCAGTCGVGWSAAAGAELRWKSVLVSGVAFPCLLLGAGLGLGA